jgi:hypothetical protein
MSLVLPNGYILDTIGPFEGRMNDASITKQITNTCDALVKWCHHGDVMICDRGFRDVIESFTDMGYEPKMPEFLIRGQKQHTTEQANKSRLITKVRWRVESYHARMKKWMLLSGRIENAFIPKIADCVRIVSAALNCYRGPIGQDTINADDDELARYMRDRIVRQNLLAARVSAGTISARSRWQKIEESTFDFPELSLDDIRQLFFGTYQIKMARTYVEEHMDPNGQYIIEVSGSNDNVVRCSIQSRHSRATVYKAWIQFSFSDDPIEAWYCQCTAGARNLGCCGHVASIIWYLSFARHNDFKPSIGRHRIYQAIKGTKQQEETDSDKSSDDE